MVSEYALWLLFSALNLNIIILLLQLNMIGVLLNLSLSVEVFVNVSGTVAIDGFIGVLWPVDVLSDALLLVGLSLQRSVSIMYTHGSNVYNMGSAAYSHRFPEVILGPLLLDGSVSPFICACDVLLNSLFVGFADDVLQAYQTIFRHFSISFLAIFLHNSLHFRFGS